MVNVDLLRKVVLHITENPEQWSQEHWAVVNECGTTCCVAGWAAVFSGHSLEWLNTAGGLVQAAFVDDGIRTISDVAQEALGLDDMQARMLFGGDNDLARIWELAQSFAEGDLATDIPDDIDVLIEKMITTTDPWEVAS